MVSVVQKKLQKKMAQRQSRLDKLEAQKKELQRKIERARVKLGAAARELKKQMRVEEGNQMKEHLEAWANKSSDDTDSSSSSSTSTLRSEAQAPRRQEVVKEEPPAGAAPEVKPELAEAVVPAAEVEAPAVHADSVAAEPAAKRQRGRPSIMPPGFAGCKACFWIRHKGSANGAGHKRDAPDHDPTLKAVKQE